ncbi:Long-chain-fatty-acid--AMP ligase FadD26 [Vitis vinifera]|uniref:Long-chain-fatty-acid--AMP ligase FadD26 n=1 Tax=Vitis vinifera TaxID=29760 RepID=A0A438J9W1_VITVI|nr:Long-chain-fatty-acid--AMP ligase FadD26 [Vitis vinifera]
MNYENYDPYFPDQPVVDLYLPVWANLPAFRSKAAFIWAEDGATLTYAQLNSSAQSISAKILHRLKGGDTVVILCSPGLELVEIILGAKELTKPKAAIAQHGFIAAVKRYVSSSVSDKRLCELLQGAEEMYLVQFTSGATGIPKPVLVTAGAAAHNVRTARKAYHLHPNSVIASWLPQYHDCGLMFLLLTIVSGATCVLTSPMAFVNRPRLWLELISEYKATCTPVPSFALPLVVKRGGIDKGTLPINLWSLKNLIIINEPIYRESVEEFVNAFLPFGLNPACISPSYGLAENCTFVSTAWRNNDEEEMDILVVNEETQEPVEDGIEGEIWVSSSSNASGYLDHPSLTRYVFLGRLSNKVSSCFVRTGDRGIVKGEERYLFITGRSSDMIELQSGEQIHPHYIETAAYNSCQKFLRGGCLAAFKISRTVVLVAEMQRREEETRILKIICEGIREAVLREEKIGIGLVVLAKAGCVPKTTSGKIQRWATKDKLIGGKMKVVMEMQFEENGRSIEAGASKRNGGRVMVGEEMGNDVISLSSAPTQVGSRSFL